MWIHLEDPAHIQRLQEDLRLEVHTTPSPTALRVYGSVIAILDGTVPEDLFVNVWPEWSVVLVKPSLKPRQDGTKHLLSTICFHCRNKDTSLTDLPLENVIDWKRHCIFACLPQEAAAYITSIGSKRGSLTKLIDCETLVHSDDALLDRPIVTPDPYLLTTVTPHMAKAVVSHWHPILEHTEATMEEAIPLVEFNCSNFPSSCIVDMTGRPIAHVLCHYYGAVGMLGLSRDHKGQGLSVLVLHDLCRKLRVHGLPVWAHIEVGNTAASELFIRSGFSTLQVDATVWLEYTPKAPQMENLSETQQTDGEANRVIADGSDS